VSESVKNRASVIREYLERVGPPTEPALRYRYSVIAARWERLRLQRDRGQSTPADDRRFWELSSVLRTLTEKIGLDALDETTDPEAIPGITSWGGFLPLDLGYLIAGETWQSAAEGW
jgi:hypothetical protein